MPHEQKHLTADQLDDFLLDHRSPLTASHVATCAACAAMVAADARVVAALRALPLFDPAPGFATAVMARVAVATAVAVVPLPESARVVAARRRAFAAIGLMAGGLAAGFVWAAIHPADALRWSAPAVNSAAHTLWISLQNVLASAFDQPWFDTIRDTLATPVRAVLVSAAIAGGYALALVGLRRLMSEPAPNAHW